MQYTNIPIKKYFWFIQRTDKGLTLFEFENAKEMDEINTDICVSNGEENKPSGIIAHSHNYSDLQTCIRAEEQEKEEIEAIERELKEREEARKEEENLKEYERID